MTTIPASAASEARAFFAQKLAFTIDPVEVNEQIKFSENITIFDVRETEDYRRGHLPGALSLPPDKWHTMNGLREDSINIIYCYSQTCHLAAKAAVQFADKGYRVVEMDGGFAEWKRHDLPVET